MVPAKAVSNDQNGPYVLLVTGENTVERRGVIPGALVEDKRVIKKGLKGDERVIVEGLLRAIPGRKVTPETGQVTTQKK